MDKFIVGTFVIILFLMVAFTLVDDYEQKRWQRENHDALRLWDRVKEICGDEPHLERLPNGLILLQCNEKSGKD